VQEEKVRATEEQRQNVLTRIINRLESKDGKSFIGKFVNNIMYVTVLVVILCVSVSYASR
jgi:hypothetical protein